MEWSERSTLLPALKIGERGSTRQKWQGVVLDAVQGGRGSRRMKKEVDVGRKGRRPDKRVGRIPRGALTRRRRLRRTHGAGLRPPASGGTACSARDLCYSQTSGRVAGASRHLEKRTGHCRGQKVRQAGSRGGAEAAHAAVTHTAGTRPGHAPESIASLARRRDDASSSFLLSEGPGRESALSLQGNDLNTCLTKSRSCSSF